MDADLRLARAPRHLRPRPRCPPRRARRARGPRPDPRRARARSGDRGGHCAVQPPSTSRLVPVTSAAASDARYTTAPVTSSTRPRRPSGMRRSTACPELRVGEEGCGHGRLDERRRDRVHPHPVRSQLDAPPPWSDPRQRAWSCSRRCVPRRPRGPSARRSGRSTPPPASTIRRAAAWSVTNAARTFSASRASSCIVRDVEQRLRRVRARADHQHVEPRQAGHQVADAASSGSRRRATGRAWRPSARTSAATRSSSSGERLTTTTSAPALASAWAHAAADAAPGPRHERGPAVEGAQASTSRRSSRMRGGERVPGERLGVARWRRRPAPPGACPRRSGAGRSPSSGTCPTQSPPV